MNPVQLIWCDFVDRPVILTGARQFFSNLLKDGNPLVVFLNSNSLSDQKYSKTGDSMSNSFKAFVACVLVMVFSVAATFGQSSHFDVTNMDTKASACTDFYQYANGGWLAANPIPAAYPAWGVANILNEKNRDVLHAILEAAANN
jgi:hypothetical protein